jgi:cyclopropane fatty-acyl-phospholipid synthase-like methyltransferase
VNFIISLLKEINQMLAKIKEAAGYVLMPLQKKFSRSRIRRLYKRLTYLEAYSKHTDIRVQLDPHQAIGGHWDEMGKIQLDFLVKQGLKPHHTLLDIGCGTLRGGRHFIRYLDQGNYTGMDISVRAIEYGQKLVCQEKLLDKQPSLRVSKNKNLKFEEFTGKKFDYLLAQSVFTHLKSEHIEECFQYVGRIMEENSIFFFTFAESNSFVHHSQKDFRYPFSFFDGLFAKYGFVAQNYSDNYPHPSGQRMIKLTKKK